MWQTTDFARRGQFIKATKIDGIWIDPFGTVKKDELLERVRQYAQGWSVSSIDLSYGLFNVGGHVYIYGLAETDVPTPTVASQVTAAFDSFLTIAASDFAVKTSDSLNASDPSDKSEWSDTLQLIAIAVIAVAVVYGIRQIKEISE